MTAYLGATFGRLRVSHEDPERTPQMQRKWVCVCECGATVSVRQSSLRDGTTKSCGCLSRELSAARVVKHNLRHGMTGSRTHRSWAGMLQRCNNQKNPRWGDYGGRGILVCERWASFDAFLKDMGPCPEGMSIDRVDNNGAYEPGNCRWATKSQQGRNKRNNVVIAAPSTGGLSVQAAADLAGTTMHAMYARIKSGMSHERAITSGDLRVSLYAVDGESNSLSVWCKRFGQPRTRVLQRLARGWSVERAFKEGAHGNLS